MNRVIFLFNHDAAHQVSHLAGVAAATALADAPVEAVIAVSSPAMAEAVRGIMGEAAAARAVWLTLDLPPALDAAAGLVDRIAPVRRLLRLRWNAERLANCAMLVSTERTCLTVRGHMPAPVPRFAIIPHGAGDRRVSYHPDFARFDLVLVAGEKVRAGMIAAGVDADHVRLVGYPKFDTVDLVRGPALFSNGRPTFVYNPHFDPYLSSWYRFGPDLLRWFAESEAGRACNLVFAPHVMLFRKKLHISPEYRTARIRPDIPAEALGADNILIDTGSRALFDMRYTLAADAYIGDMSSQIYEFLAIPRPAFFLDGWSHTSDEGEETRMHWRAGPVARSVAELTALLPDWRRIGEEYRGEQERLFGWTFDQSGAPSTKRAAQAIIAAVMSE